MLFNRLSSSPRIDYFNAEEESRQPGLPWVGGFLFFLQVGAVPCLSLRCMGWGRNLAVDDGLGTAGDVSAEG